jgi:hypothetical protein
MMSDFVHDLTLAQLFWRCVAVTVGATWVGVLFVKPFLRLLLGREANVNESISYATSMFSLFYGLLVGLLTVAAFQNAERVERNMASEASLLGALYADMDSYPEPTRSDMREMLRDYVLFTIHKDWPAHREGRTLTGGANRADAMRKRLAAFQPANASQEILHAEAMRLFHDFGAARQDRLGGVLTRIPPILWYAVAIGAVINVMLLIMLKIRLFQHLLLGGVASFFLGVMLCVIIALDDPLRGEQGLSPAPFEALWLDQMRFDEPLV